MFCPKCGREIVRQDMRCEGCGSDVKRIVREEFWEETSEGDKVQQERFRPEESSYDYGWRSSQAGRRLPLMLMGIGSAVLAIMLCVVYFGFRAPSKPEDKIPPPATGPVTNVPPTTASATAPAAPVPITEEEVKKRIEDWRVAWEKSILTNKLDAYGAFYSSDFKFKPTGEDKAAFLKIRAKQAQGSTFLLIKNYDLQITIEADKAIVTFKQYYLSDKTGKAGTEKLTLARRGPSLLILDEEFQDQTPQPQVTEDQVKERVLAWRKAWEDLAMKKETDSLKEFYDPDFHTPTGRDLSYNLNQKLDLAKKSTIIAIDVKNIKSSILGDHVLVSFNQTFKSDTFSDVGTKILGFQLKNGKLLITAEAFRLGKYLPDLQEKDFWGK